MARYVETEGRRLYEGSIVRLPAYPDTKWMLCNGWCTIEGEYYIGWYFKSIPEGAFKCADSVLLASAVVVGDDSTVIVESDQSFCTGTTPTFIMSFKEDIDLTLAVTVAFTLTQGGVQVRKELPDLIVSEKQVTVTLDQEDTLQLSEGAAILQLNWVYEDGKRDCSNKIGVFVLSNSLNEVI